MLSFPAPIYQVAVPEITEAVKGASILIFVIPHQFIGKLCDQMKPHITQGTIGISLIKVMTFTYFSHQLSLRKTIAKIYTIFKCDFTLALYRASYHSGKVSAV